MKKKSITNIDISINSTGLKFIVRIILFIFITFVVIYPFFTLQTASENNIKTQTAVKRTVYDTVDTTAILIRNEYVLPDSFSGVVVPFVDNCEKVSKGEGVAGIYGNEDVAKNASLRKELENEINYYSSIMGQNEGNSKTDIDFYRGKVSEALYNLNEAIYNNEISNIYNLSRNFRDACISKQISTGEKIDVNEVLDRLRNQYSSLENIQSASTVVYAESAGNYTNFCDGYEGIFDYSNAKKLTPEIVDEYLKKEPNISKINNVGKIITSFKWYLVCNVDVESISFANINDMIEVSFINSYVEDLKMKVVAINREIGSSKATLVLESNSLNADIISLSKAEIRLKGESHSGLVVSRRALRTVDGQKGVYIKNGKLAVFRAVNIVYTSDNYVLVNNIDNQLSNHLELYEEIILEGVGLHDSKFL